jgi:hypothetical protein
MTAIRHKSRPAPTGLRLRNCALLIFSLAAAVCFARLLDNAVTRATHAALHPCTAEGC